MNLIKKANELFQDGAFREALDLYNEASDTYGYRYLDSVIEICRKKVEQSSSILNRYFDHVYVVNLKQNTVNRLKIANHLMQRGVKFELFEGTNGYAGEPLGRFEEYRKHQIGDLKRYSAFNEKEISENRLFIESPGAIGYIYTYVKILKDAQKKGYSRFLILEDDVILDKHFENRFSDFLQKIDDAWKILQLGASQYSWDRVDMPEAKSEGFYLPRVLDTCGSFAIAFDSSVVDELIEAESAFEAPFDHLPLGEIYEKYLGKCFVAYPNMVMPDVGDSFIRPGRCQYDHSSKMKWNLSRFDYPLSKPSIAVLINSRENLKYYPYFSHTKDLPFDLRIYFNSTDGIRPLHSVELLDSPENVICPLENKPISIPESDFAATLDEDAIVSEADLIKFIAFKTGIRGDNPTSLAEIKA